MSCNEDYGSTHRFKVIFIATFLMPLIVISPILKIGDIILFFQSKQWNGLLVASNNFYLYAIRNILAMHLPNEDKEDDGFIWVHYPSSIIL